MSQSIDSPLLSICIPTWNRAGSLRKTIDSLVSVLPELPEGSIELCLSDNASSDETSAVILEAENLRIPVHTARMTENFGFSVNYWSAASLATGRFTWITGDDDRFDVDGLISLVSALSECREDLLLLGSAPWKKETETLADQFIDGIGGYLRKLGIFHASFIGNSVFSTKSLHAYLRHEATLASAYPHMAPIFGLLRHGSSRFLNLCPLIIDDTSRSWYARQPLLTSVDMARLVTDLAFTGAQYPLVTRLGIYILLLRSLPRAVTRVTRNVFEIDPANPYQSISSGNLIDCYRAVPLAGTVACFIARLTHLAVNIFPHRIAD